MRRDGTGRGLTGAGWDRRGGQQEEKKRRANKQRKASAGKGVAERVVTIRDGAVT
jgi:hypothetical protein